jgi:cytochrome P450
MRADDAYERPRIRIVSNRLAPPVELARWLMERHGVPYEEEVHAAAFHALRSVQYGVAVELPVVVWPEGPTGGVMPFLDAFDDRGRPGERLYGEGEDERRETRQLVVSLYEKLFRQAVNVYYFHLLPHRSAVVGPAVQGAPFWQRACVWALFPVWRLVMRRGLGLGQFNPAEAIASIDAVFDQVARAVGPDRPYLAGQAPGTADIVFAALASPIILPAKHPARLPAVDDLPAEMKAIVTRYRGHPAGQLVERIYDAARPVPQPPLRARRNPFSVSALLGRPAVLRAAGRVLRSLAPRLRVGKTLVVSRWADVCEILDRDTDFRIAPINAARINAVSGPFILGMDRSDELTRQREAVYGALGSADLGPFRAVLDAEPRRLLRLFAARHGRIDVVNSYARVVAARTAAALFGIRGPTEQDLLRVCRAVFHETFLNLGGDPGVAAKAAAAGRELAGWIEAEMAARRARGTPGDDVLGRLMVAQQRDPELVPESVRWMLAGLLVGAIDTTATAVANIVAECLADRRLSDGMSRDLDDRGRFLGWCWEALRRRPHNPLLLRQAAEGAEFGGKTLTGDVRVVAFTLSAMYDPAVFEHPGRLDPARPADRYLHFGRGLHTCAGRDLNAVQLPALVRELLRFGMTAHSGVRSQGPFPDVFVVALRGEPA